eukprot:TRINITY_DN4176_c0_g1_i1.p1 TRINITY_DN4176_c0_g1~~TRINITY_DN4176_c0_g1_i1.p1  ORF type:complete len:74 (-),score=0.38 TRINITY_DN4176_c0_g1_i1:12-233(-)
MYFFNWMVMKLVFEWPGNWYSHYQQQNLGKVRWGWGVGFANPRTTLKIINRVTLFLESKFQKLTEFLCPLRCN